MPARDRSQTGELREPVLDVDDFNKCEAVGFLDSAAIESQSKAARAIASATR